MVTTNDYKSIDPAWCPGCGDFGILNAVKKALVAMNRRPEEVLLVSGIGQAAKLPHYLRCNVFNGLHGRALPAATGAKIANGNLLVIAIGGDGDMYGEGGNHLLHAIRRNLNLTLLVNNNKIYGLTKGQASPTTDLGIKTKVQSEGVINGPLNPLALAICQHGSFVARSFSGDIDHLAKTIQAGVENPGFSMIDILQPCVSFNHVNTFDWYRSRVYKLEDEKGYNAQDMHAALDKANEWGDRIPIGVFFRSPRQAYDAQVHVLTQGALLDQKLDPNVVLPLMKNYY